MSHEASGTSFAPGRRGDDESESSEVGLLLLAVRRVGVGSVCSDVVRWVWI